MPTNAPEVACQSSNGTINRDNNLSVIVRTASHHYRGHRVTRLNDQRLEQTSTTAVPSAHSHLTRPLVVTACCTARSSLVWFSTRVSHGRRSVDVVSH
ncbi:hypothetical protein PUN28_019801 [Cardiocondyla obscurior]|uniref:Uncharacterized protein n=1 Tax=Cardiocondyla obscurior TaxID=286306 RepID=A0AAW2EBD0_9HYME